MDKIKQNKKLVMTLAVLAVATIGVFGLAGSAQAVREYGGLGTVVCCVGKG